MSRPRDPQVGMLGARPLPPGWTRAPAARPARATRKAAAPAGSGRRPAPRDAVRPGARRIEHDAALDEHPTRGFGRVLGLTTLGALLPGTGFLAAGYRKVGWILLAGLVALIGLGAWLATGGQHMAIRLAVSPTGLLLIIAGRRRPRRRAGRSSSSPGTACSPPMPPRPVST